MQAKWFFGILALLIVALSAVSYGQSVPVFISEVQLDDVTLVQSPFDNRLDVERGKEVELEIQLEAFGDADDVEVMAFLSGYEYNNVEPVNDRTPTFEVEDGVRYIKRLHLKIPDLVETDDYKLRIIVSDRNNFEFILNYDLKLDTKRHDLKIKEVMIYPESDVKSGTALLARVRVENYGQKDEEDVRVRVSIPDLGLSVVDYINEVESDEEEETEEMYLKLPCAKPGTYGVKVDVAYNNGKSTLAQSRSINLVEGDLCKALAAPTAQTTQVTQTPAPAAVQPAPQKSMLRTALEIILLVLVVLLVLVGLVIGFGRMRADSE